jgi:hypothetical protein
VLERCQRRTARLKGQVSAIAREFAGLGLSAAAAGTWHPGQQ